jgi:hypothetical protein
MKKKLFNLMFYFIKKALNSLVFTRVFGTLFFLIFFLSNFLFTKQLVAQNPIFDTIIWQTIDDQQTTGERFLYFSQAVYEEPEYTLPIYQGNMRLNAFVEYSIALFDIKTELLSVEEKKLLKNYTPKSLEVVSKTTYSGKIPYLIYSFSPFILNANGEIEKIISFTLHFTKKGGISSVSRSYDREYVSNSVLSNGTWYKIGVVQEGVYKLSYQYLKDKGIDVDNTNPKNINIYGNGAGMLPQDNGVFRYDDLQPCAIHVEGENDNVFHPQDYILFYGQSQDKWTYNGSTFVRERNLFSDTTYYFIGIQAGNAKRIESRSSLTSFTHEVVDFDDYTFHESDRSNLIRSGTLWLGEEFGTINQYSFNFRFGNLVKTSPVEIKTNVVSRTVKGISSFDIQCNNYATNITDNSLSGNYATIYATQKTGSFIAYSNTNNLKVDVIFNKGNSEAKGWLNYIELFAKRELILEGNQLFFRNKTVIAEGNIANYKIRSANPNVLIWDVTNHQNVVNQSYIFSNNTAEFNASSNVLRQYVAFKNDGFLEPVSIKAINNQDLHGKASLFPAYIIVTHPLFKSQAEDLAQFHFLQDGLTSLVVTTDEIYNEFSSGSKDITAIKDMVKMFYDQAGNNPSKIPKYLLLFGDASYDYKNRISGNTCFVPAFQSVNSVDPVGSYVSDDYFGLLDNNESNSINDLVDIGIGRLPVKNVEQAKDMVKKVKQYYAINNLKPWRNWLTFIGDDEDNNIHMSQADDLAEKAKQNKPHYNIEKLYLDAYPQERGAGGSRYPAVKEAINNRVSKGGAIITFVGHGGELGWTHERILEVPQINSWNNINNLPLFLTATCEFSRFDDPLRTSAGEYVLLNPRGGGIALLTTTRLVYSSQNKALMDAFYRHAFDEMDASNNRLGDLTRVTKVMGPKSVNTRNFSLLGDPAVRLTYATYKVKTNVIPDTIKALSKVYISGEVVNQNGIRLDDFNGTIYPLVFDKKKTIRTLQNDGNTPVFEFEVRNNVIFNGKASVKNGVFEFEFIAPKDIDLTYGQGEVTYYAENGMFDAVGQYDNFIVGGIN